MSGRIESKRILFLIRLVFFFLLFYFLWHSLCPLYNHVLATPSALILKLSEVGGEHVTNSMQAQGEYIFVHHAASEKKPELTIRIHCRRVHFDMVFLFALIWAVPHVKWKQRRKLFLLGFAIIFVLHLLKIFIFVKADYALNIMIGGVPYWSPFEQKAYRYLSAFVRVVVSQIAPVFIWSLLFVNHWWGKRLKLRAR